jgi:hypothetical protein
MADCSTVILAVVVSTVLEGVSLRTTGEFIGSVRVVTHFASVKMRV